MKPLILALLLVFTTQAHAFIGDEWTPKQKNLALAYLGTRVLDWSQSRYIAKHPDQYRETNPFMRDHPSLGEVNRHFIIGTGAGLLVADLLPQRWRDAGLYILVGVSGAHVLHNFSIGIGLSF